MPKSKTILRYSIIILLLFLFLLIRISKVQKQSRLEVNTTEFIGRVNQLERKENYTKIGININGENLSGNIYNQSINNLEYNDLVKITGNLKEIEELNNFYSFSYKDYLKRHNQFFKVKIDKIKLIKVKCHLKI